MGSYYGAELCELVGFYIMQKYHQILLKRIWVYTGRLTCDIKEYKQKKTDRMKKDIIKTFQSISFSIEIDTNLKYLDFLDVTFNLQTSSYYTYKKPNDSLMYINTAVVSKNHRRKTVKRLVKRKNI